MTDDPFTMSAPLCDNNGLVSHELRTPAISLAPGLTYLRQLNNMRAHTGLPPVDTPFTCTGSAHLAGEHIRCTSPAHHRASAEPSNRAHVEPIWHVKATVPTGFAME